MCGGGSECKSGPVKGRGEDWDWDWEGEGRDGFRRERKWREVKRRKRRVWFEEGEGESSHCTEILLSFALFNRLKKTIKFGE